MDEQILVCIHCGKNGSEVTIEERSTYVGWVDEYGEAEDSEIEYSEHYCCDCDRETDLITLGKYKALARDKQIDEILKD